MNCMPIEKTLYQKKTQGKLYQNKCSLANGKERSSK